MNKEQIDNLAATFGNLATSAAQQLDPIYGPAMLRLGIEQALALRQYFNLGDYANVMKTIRAAMTADELAGEKDKLAALGWNIAEANATGWDFGRSVALAGLKVLLAAALAGVGL